MTTNTQIPTSSNHGILVPEFNFSAGTESVVRKITEAWVTTGRRVVLAAPAHRLNHYDRIGLDAKVIRAPFLWPRKGWQRVLRGLQRTGRAPASFQQTLLSWRLRQLSKQHHCTVAFIPWLFDLPNMRLPLPYGALAMDLAWHHFPAGAYSPRSREILDKRFSRWLDHATTYFPVSEATANEIKQSFPHCRTPMKTIPHGADLINRPKRSSPSQTPLFIYPAGFSVNKAHLLLLQVGKLLLESGINFRLVFTGHGTTLITRADQIAPLSLQPVQEFYRQHADLFHGHIEALGFTDRDNLEQLYATARRVVLPSTYEGFGLPLVEAFSRGADIICSDIPPFREQISRYSMEDRVHVVSASTPEAWADSMRSAIELPHPVPPPPAELRSRLQRWSWSDAATAYLEELDKIARS